MSDLFPHGSASGYQATDTSDAYTGPPGAPFGIRALARVIDSLFGLVLGFVAVSVAVILLILGGAPGDPADWLAGADDLSAEALLLSIVASVGYHTVSEYVGAASLGKILCGLRVISVEGGSVTLYGATMRSAVYLIDSLFFGLVAYATMTPPRMQRFGDKWGHTLVVRRRDTPADVRAGALLVTCGILVGALIWMAPTVHRLVNASSN